MKRRWLPSLAAILALAPLLACERKPVLPMAPAPPPSTLISAVFPAARATGVQDSDSLWVQFAAPVDPASITNATLFLKLYTVRVPMDFHYDSTSHRLTLLPRTLLALLETYTVELTPRIVFRDGQHLPATYHWEFTMASAHRPSAPWPADGSPDASPISALVWRGTESSAGIISYRVYASTDSIAVATRATMPSALYGNPILVTPTARGFDETTYWSVTALNLTTGESVFGPVWSFHTLPASTPIDSLPLVAARYGHDYRRLGRGACDSTFLLIDDTAVSAARWDLPSPPAPFRIAGCAIQMSAPRSTNSSALNMVLEPTTETFDECYFGPFGPPFADGNIGPLASSTRRTEVDTVFYGFSSNALASHLEAGIVGRAPRGYRVRGSLSDPVALRALTGDRSVVYYYRLP